jgi:SPX domain protein involved in polyphosphate accumulation
MLIITDLKTQQTIWKSSPRPGDPFSWRARPGTVVMKFGEELRSSIIHEYQWYYIDYDGLKADLKRASGAVVDNNDETKVLAKVSKRQWTEDDEKRFVSHLEAELEKVHQKQQVKASEIQRRIAISERDVGDVINRLRERGTGPGPSEEEFMLLEEDLSDIIADVHDLAKFVQVNYTGFYKIIKKHDVGFLPVLSGSIADLAPEIDWLVPEACI